MFVQLLLVIISTALVNNVVLSQFLGLCPFLGVSKKTDMAAGMGAAVIFVIVIASAVANLIQNLLLVPQGIDYLQTIVFILVIAGLVQFVEMFLKKAMPALYESLGVYLPLITTNCAVLGVAINNTADYPVGADYTVLTSLIFSVVSGLGIAVGNRITGKYPRKDRIQRFPGSFQRISHCVDYSRSHGNCHVRFQRSGIIKED